MTFYVLNISFAVHCCKPHLSIFCAENAIDNTPCYYLYINSNNARSLIGVHLWSITGQRHTVQILI